VSADTPRVRMFAGPNGSGKTTVKNELPAQLFKNYINPDDFEQSLRSAGSMDLNPFGLTISTQELREFFAASELLRANDLDGVSDIIECRNGILTLNGAGIDSYFASVLSDFLRRKLLESSKSFTFETVMSAPDKVDLLAKARRRGYRTYLYFVATEDPAINVERVKNRVASGGHNVPEMKIVSRYHRSLELLRGAIRNSDRAYFFDTSEESSCYFAEITGGVEFDLKSPEIPEWFRSAVWDKP